MKILWNRKIATTHWWKRLGMPNKDQAYILAATRLAASLNSFTEE